ncbi:MAG: GIY-YIG nuclease family protein [Lysobacteraceae bacterium]
MDSLFQEKLGRLPDLLAGLLMSPAMSPAALSPSVSGPGVYLLSDRGIDLYVGRTRNLRRRIQQHVAAGSGERVAAFAFRLAREATGHVTASYRRELSRVELMNQSEFAAALNDAKKRIHSMTVRTVRIEDDLTQCLFEIYAATVLSTRHNSFRTH